MITSENIPPLPDQLKEHDENMTNSGMTNDEKMQIRLSLVTKLRDAGYTSALSISNKLKDGGYEYLDISEKTISRDLRRIREKGLDFVERVLLSGEFIVEFHEALQEFKRIRNRCSEEVAKAEAQHELRETEIDKIPNNRRYIEVDKMRLKLQNDVNHHSIKQKNERMLLQATKEYLTLFNKTEVVWALKKWIKENNPQAFERPALQDIINNLEESEDEK